jgi:1-acyl-sn-glycerol-3-phosphate acyltransferase
MKLRGALALILFVPYISFVGLVLCVIVLVDLLLRTAPTKRYDHVNSLITLGGHCCWLWLKPLMSMKEEIDLPPEWFSRKKSFLVLFTHKKISDAVIMPDVFWRGRRQVRFIVKKEILDAPIIGQLLRAGGAVGLSRNDKRFDRAQITKLTERAKEDNADILLAPEGTRHDEEGVGEPKPGGFAWIREDLPNQPVVVLELKYRNARRGRKIFDISAVGGATICIKGTYYETIEGKPVEWLRALYRDLARSKEN